MREEKAYLIIIIIIPGVISIKQRPLPSHRERALFNVH
jgi:hypothetical protein